MNGCIAIISGGISEDDDLTAFWDYVYTLERMKLILEKNGLKSPFIISSDVETKIQCYSNNHISPIAKEVIEKNGEFHVIRGNIWVNEYDYIMAKDWVEVWKVEKIERDGYDEQYPYYYLKLEKDGRYVITGRYGGLTIA